MKQKDQVKRNIHYYLFWKKFVSFYREKGLKYALKKAKNNIPRRWSYLSAPMAHLEIILRKIIKKLGLSKYNHRMCDIAKVKNRHDGERCFIICTGPSLKIEDIEMLKGEFTIGVNSIFQAFEETDWRPTYYAIVDKYVYKQYVENYELDLDTFSKREIFLNSYIPIKNSGRIKKCLVHYGNHTNRNMRLNHIKIEEDIAVCIYDCFTVTNMAINVAIYMGFKEIYIIGADCNFEGENIHFIPNTFDPEGEEKGRWELFVNRSINGYKAMKKFAELNGVKVYNSTRGGFLEVFERVAFDSIEKRKGYK